IGTACAFQCGAWQDRRSGAAFLPSRSRRRAAARHRRAALDGGAGDPGPDRLGVHYEMRTSYLEAWIFTRLDRGMSFGAQPGPSEAIRFPKHGPYDERLGYVALPK